MLVTVCEIIACLGCCALILLPALVDLFDARARRASARKVA